MLSSTLKYGGFALVFFVGAAQFGQKLTLLSATRRPSQAAAITQTPSNSPNRPAAPINSRTPSTLDEYRIAANDQGHYVTDAFVNGQPIKAVVDTGATSVALRQEDAEALGIFPAPSDYTISVQTANGIARAAPVTLREVNIGSIQLFDVEAIVAERGALSVNLLGMTYLSRLSRVEMVAGSLLLRR